MSRLARLLLQVLFFVTLGLPSGARASVGGANAEISDASCDDAGICGMDLVEPVPSEPAKEEPTQRAVLLFFWGVGCPHCEEAKAFLERLRQEYPQLAVDAVEVRKDANARKRFIETMKRLRADVVGVPTFVMGERYIIGFSKGGSEPSIRAMVEEALGIQRVVNPSTDTPSTVLLPLLGTVNSQKLSLPLFTVLVGVVDGVNPCAIWVLLVLLGILAHVRSVRRLALIGGTFVVMSGVVYFIFMTAWLSLFQLVGLSRVITVVLGVVILLMGVVNLKELLWFKRGVSLTIPERAKPHLFRRMRAIANAASLPAAIFGVIVLSFLVNLIELACTIGLPAVYTRVLSAHAELSHFERYAYLVLYNVAYIIPLALVIVVYALTMRRLALSERGAKVLKAMSGALLVVFGALFIFAPDLVA